MPDQKAELAGKFWDLANYVAGFAAAQMITFLLAMATQEALVVRVRHNRWVVVSIMIVFNLIVYVGGVWACFRAECQLRAVADPTLHHVRRAWFYRILWIGAFTLLGIGSVFLVQPVQPGR